MLLHLLAALVAAAVAVLAAAAPAAALLDAAPPDQTPTEGWALTEDTVQPSSPSADTGRGGRGRPGHDTGTITVVRGEPASLGFTAGPAGEAVVELTVSAPGIDWGTEGAESAVVSLGVDGRHAADLVVPSADAQRRRLALGSVGPGRHELTFELSDAASAAAATKVTVSDATVDVVAPGDEELLALRHAPVLLGRSIAVTNSEGAGTSYEGPLQNAVTDTPLLAWHEVRDATTAGHRVLEYSVVWSNEDGGTNSPALMARWGRTTDIEWIYRVEVDADGDAVPGTAVYQGPDHATLPFDGAREGDHPVLQTCTANNMVCDDVADAGMRFFPAADATRPPDRAREVLMDENPWTYQVMAAEMLREGRIESPSDPATPALGDQRTYLYLEIDKDTLPPNSPGPRWVGVAVEVRLADGRRFRSDHAIPDWSIQRDVPAATTVELPAGATADHVMAISTVRVPVGVTDTGATVQVTDVNRAFLLDEAHRPQASFVDWTGDVTLTPAQPTATLWSR